MNVKLSPELERRVAEHVASHGRYATPEAFVEHAIEVFLGTEDDELQSLLSRADREINAGAFVEYDASNVGDLARDVHARGMKRTQGR